MNRRMQKYIPWNVLTGKILFPLPSDSLRISIQYISLLAKHSTHFGIQTICTNGYNEIWNKDCFNGQNQ